jgi:hypothetical protein
LARTAHRWRIGARATAHWGLVDQMVAKALASGDTAWKPTSDEGPVRVGSFRAPDDHPWEILHVDQGAWSGGGGALPTQVVPRRPSGRRGT